MRSTEWIAPPLSVNPISTALFLASMNKRRAGNRFSALYFRPMRLTLLHSAYGLRAFVYTNRANARCHLGQVEASLDDRLQALRLGAFTAEAAQSFLRDRGFYPGAIDGAFGPVSQKALRDWTAAGCPGV